MPELTPKLSKQHAVPQHIAAFEFKLIGDLTVKQFLFAGVGIAVSYAAWISDLNFFVKWGTIILAAGLGLGTAFFPIQDRTLDQWILNFIVAIFSPTQRIWRKEPAPPEYLREDYSQFLTSQVLSLTPLQSRRKLQQYLEGLGEERPKSEVAEQEFIEKLNFDLPLPAAAEVKPQPEAKPPVEIRKEGLPERRELPSEPKLASEIDIARKQTYKVPTEKETRYITTLKNITPGRKVRLPTIEGTVRLKPKEIKPLPERKLSPLPPKEPIKELIKEVKEKPKAAPLVPPKEKGIPNLVRGVVKDSGGKLLENAIVIVKDEDSDPVRALKTNELGQFAVSTSLENGAYTVEVSSKDKYFDIIKVTADGSVLPPLEFREKYG